MQRSFMLRCASLCALAATPAAKLELYNCEVNAQFWETAWTPDWQAWCCLNHPPRGCPSTSTETQTSSTATSTTATTTETSTSTTETSTTTLLTSTLTSTTTASEDWCAKSCEFEGSSATCGDRIKWALEHVTMNEASPAEAAQVLVSTQCEVCASCSADDAGSDELMVVKEFEMPSSILGGERVAAGRLAASWPGALCGCFLLAGSIVFAAHRRRRHLARSGGGVEGELLMDDMFSDPDGI